MKVRETSGRRSDVASAVPREERKVPYSEEASFQAKLKRIEAQSSDVRINDLVERITRQGKKLGEKIDIRELKIYKNLISEFLDEAIGNSHRFSKRNFLDRRGRHKVFAMVKKINDELDLLTKDILNGEKDNIKILQRLDDIRGLILDLAL